jgi:protein gp37
MGIKTNIEWCDSTCNVLIGCTGCELSGGHCYAEDLVTRHAGQKGWPEAFAKPTAYPYRLDEALGWPDLTGRERPQKPWLNGLPRLVFLNDLSDSFGFPSPDYFAWFNEAVRRMADSPHVWILLTKQPGRMAAFIDLWRHALGRAWPRNIWGGVTVTGPDTVNRIAELVRIPLAVRLVSFEPLLGPIAPSLWLAAKFSKATYDVSGRFVVTDPKPMLHWIIAGGESGRNARPAHPDWFRSLRDQCQAAAVPFFFKQWGEWIPMDEYSPFVHGADQDRYDHRFLYLDGTDHPDSSKPDLPTSMFRVGKKAAGRFLDGRTWEEMPKWSK